MSEALERVRIGDGELGKFGEVGRVADRAHALFLQQREGFELARKGYGTLDRVRVRRFDLDGFEVRVQFNPGRAQSSSAKVDARSIRQRPCFLCPANLPEGQRGIPYGEGFLILINPFPIFPEHFTIPAFGHRPQRIEGLFATLLDLSRDLSPRYTVFYNGPRCGASAPDHLHLQAGTRGFMPIEGAFAALKERFGETCGMRGGVEATRLVECACRCVALESDDREGLAGECARLMVALRGLAGEKGEPMVNLIAGYDEGWRVLVIPRARHRPSFYSTGEEGIMLSPATVELGGVCITPREEDFRRIEREQIAAMFDEVCLAREELRRLKERFGR